MRKTLGYTASCAALILLLSACGTGGGAAGAAGSSSSMAASVPQGEHKVLIAYFSYGENRAASSGGDIDANASASIQPDGGEMTGNTGLIARDIQNAVGGDLFSIRTETPYPAGYNDTVSVGREEQLEKARPALTVSVDNMDGYDVVFLGYPNWWGDMPMAVYSFLDSYDLSGKTVIPFCTSGGSALSDTVASIRAAEPGASVLDGFHARDRDTDESEDAVRRWLETLSLL